MTNEQALQWFRFKFDKAKGYYDEHWDATERREHKEYVEAMNCAIEALTDNAELLKLLEQHELTKSLLEIAVFDIKKVADDNCCYGCKHNNGLIEFGQNCERFKRDSNCYKWEHEEQALKLIRGDDNAVTGKN